MEDKFDKINELIDENKVVLFMKGTKKMPFCGFSRQVVNILEDLDINFFDVDVLEDQKLREDLKEFSSWPTFPQLYVDKELIGGCDIVTEMYRRGELIKIFGK